MLHHCAMCNCAHRLGGGETSLTFKKEKKILYNIRASDDWNADFPLI